MLYIITIPKDCVITGEILFSGKQQYVMRHWKLVELSLDLNGATWFTLQH